MTCSKGKHHSESNRFRILWAFNSFLFFFFFGWIKLDNWHQIKTQLLNENNGRINNWAKRFILNKERNYPGGERINSKSTHLEKVIRRKREK
jgi:hypothetical protein